MSKKRWRDSVILFIAVALVSIGLVYLNQPMKIDNKMEVIRVEGFNKVFSEFGAENFTCTGLTWDEKDGSFWVGDYGALTNEGVPCPRVVEVSGDLNEVIRIVDLSNVLSAEDNLQGVAYDNVTDSLWLATSGSVKNIEKNGSLLFEFDLGRYSGYSANGICVDDTDDSLWVLCYSKYLLHYDKKGELFEVFKVNYKDQDHIVSKNDILLVTVGADYTGDENYMVSIDKKSGKMREVYQVIGAHAMEGIAIVDDKVYITNDGLYHDALIKESYITVFDFVE